MVTYGDQGLVSGRDIRSSWGRLGFDKWDSNWLPRFSNNINICELFAVSSTVITLSLVLEHAGQRCGWILRCQTSQHARDPRMAGTPSSQGDGASMLL